MSRWALLVSCGLIMTFTVAAQQPPRDAPAGPRTGSAMLGGRITGEDGRPVRRAAVTLIAAELEAARTLVTADDGAFTFASVPAGRYTVAAAKPGFVTTTFGAKRPGHQGSAIVLAEGERRTDLVIRLVPGAVISGTLVDQTGEPIADLPVTLLRFSPSPSGRVLSRIFSVPGSASKTDERGVYRFFGLAAGDYVVVAAPISRGGLRLVTQADLDRAERPALERVDGVQVTYAPVFFPGTTSAAGATTLSLAAGEERIGVDFALPLVPTARVEGTLTNAAGPPPTQNVLASLVRDEPVAAPIPGPLLTSSARPSDGGFSFTSVPPGQYVAVAIVGNRGLSIGGAGGSMVTAGGARASSSGPTLWAMAPVTVEGRDVSGVSLVLQPGMTISGRAIFDGTTASAPASATLVLRPDSGGFQISSSARTVQIDANGRFTAAGLLPGRYQVAAQVGPAWAIRSVLLSGRDVVDAGLAIAPGQNVDDLVVTFTDRIAEISGALQDLAGRPTTDYTVIAYPADRGLWTAQSRRIAAVRPSSEGTFRLSALPPGEYLLAAVDDIEPYEWFDPRVLEQLMAASLRASLAEGEKKVQDLRLAGR